MHSISIKVIPNAHTSLGKLYDWFSIKISGELYHNVTILGVIGRSCLSTLSAGNTSF